MTPALNRKIIDISGDNEGVLVWLFFYYYHPHSISVSNPLQVCRL